MRRFRSSRPTAPPTAGAKRSSDALRAMSRLREEHSGKTQCGTRRRIAVVEQVQAALILVGLADGVGRSCQRRHTAQEPAVGLVAVGHRTEALPSVAAQLIKTAVI